MHYLLAKIPINAATGMSYVKIGQAYYVSEMEGEEEKWEG